MSDARSRLTHVTSVDGTEIAVTVTGRGRPLVVSPGPCASRRTGSSWQTSSHHT